MREISTFKERILQYANKKGITKYEIYQNTGISNGVFSQKGGLSEDNILKFLSYYIDISPEWFLTGKGPILKTDNPEVVRKTTTSDHEAANNLTDRLVTENTNLATQLGMQIKENEQLHKQNMELLAVNERLTNKAKKVTARPADTMDHYPIAAESKPEYK